jgi:hypothetical protein
MGGWGGRRVGSGRKPKGRQASIVPHPSVPPPTTNGAPTVEEFDAPDALTRDERNVWLKQAPHAFANGTLTRASALAFERYCQVVVLERAEAGSTGRGGNDHRGLLKQINTLELQFNLVPCGKPMAVPAAKPTASTEDTGGKLSRFRG